MELNQHVARIWFSAWNCLTTQPTDLQQIPTFYFSSLTVFIFFAILGSCSKFSSRLTCFALSAIAKRNCTHITRYFIYDISRPFLVPLRWDPSWDSLSYLFICGNETGLALQTFSNPSRWRLGKLQMASLSLLNLFPIKFIAKLFRRHQKVNKRTEIEIEGLQYVLLMFFLERQGKLRSAKNKVEFRFHGHFEPLLEMLFSFFLSVHLFLLGIKVEHSDHPI